MELNEFDIELFDKYLMREMDNSEKSEFEKSLEENKEFKEKFDFYLFLVEGIKEKGKEELKELIAEDGKVNYITNIWGKKGTIASFAVILIFAIAYFLQDKFINKNHTDGTPTLVESVETKRKEQPNPVIKQKEEPKVAFIPDSTGIAMNNNELSDSDSTEFDMAFSDIHDSDIFEDEEAPIASNMPHKMADSTSMTMLREINSEDDIVEENSLVSDTAFKVFSFNSEESDNNINIQFWKSPLNSKVYKFISNEESVELYGIKSSSVKGVVKSELGTVYIILEGSYYELKPSNSYQQLRAEKNKEIYKKLTEIINED